ncbi:hypothetical protein FXO37_27282 [Capsicum annuum]|nr:hypothetical protein FXO37_27282 [Capsicum annuum]
MSNHTRSNAWVTTRNNSHELSCWFEENVKNIEDSIDYATVGASSKLAAIRSRYPFKTLIVIIRDEKANLVFASCSFLGTLSKNGTFCPLNLSWTKLKKHDDMWSYIQVKYNIPNNGKDWAMRSIDAAFRGYKFRLKKDHFYAYTNDEIQMAKRPTSVPETIFEDFLK